MIYKNFRISGEGAATLDFGELMKVELTDDNVRSFDTRWNEVLSAMTERPGDNILGSRHRFNLENSEELKYLMRE